MRQPRWTAARQIAWWGILLGWACALLLGESAHAASLVVPGTSNPWLAGMPAGSTASDGDVAPDQSPVEVLGVPISPGSVLIFSATGAVRKGPAYPDSPPDGDAVDMGPKVQGPENGLSDLIAPKNALLGVFLGPGQPDQSPAPARLVFFSSQSRDYRTLLPELKQVFFIGDGLTSAGLPQRIVVPSGATRLFLGTMDGVGWYNNEGSFSVEVLREAPAITIGDTSVVEGNSGTTTANFLVQLSMPSSQVVTVDYSTSDSTASAGSDYGPIQGTVAFPPGETSKTISVLVFGDTAFESDETFFVNFRGSSNGIIARNQGRGTILNDDSQNIPPVVGISNPANAAVFAAPAQVMIVADAKDSDGTIAKVEFFRDSVKLGEDTHAPYGFSWTNAPLGVHLLTARATDDLGLSSTSSPVTISVVIPPNTPPQVAIIEPLDHALFPPNTDIKLTAAAADRDGSVAQVEFYAGSRFLGASTSSPFSLLWTNATVGDYVVIAKAIDDRGATATNSVMVAVTPISGDVAIVQNSEDPEIGKLREYLYEMGLSSHVFVQPGLTYEALQRFQLVIWDDAGDPSRNLTDNTVNALQLAWTNGIPLYLIGENLASAGAALSDSGKQLWTQLIHLQPASGKVSDATVELLGGGFVHPILRGSFGIAENFAYAGRIDLPSEGTPNAEVSARAGGADVLVAYPDQNEADFEGVRAVSQVFLVFNNGDFLSQSERKKLFQSSVCWLVRCPTCPAINARIETSTSAEVARVGEALTYELSVFHFGECEATGVVVTNTLPLAARFVSADTEQGTWRQEGGAIIFNLGRLAKASQTKLTITIVPRLAGILRNLASLRINGSEVTLDDNTSETITQVEGAASALLSIAEVANGQHELRLKGEPGRNYRIQTSTNLTEWIDLTNVTGANWAMPLPGSGSAKPRKSFYRGFSP